MYMLEIIEGQSVLMFSHILFCAQKLISYMVELSQLQGKILLLDSFMIGLVM